MSLSRKVVLPAGLLAALLLSACGAFALPQVQVDVPSAQSEAPELSAPETLSQEEVLVELYQRVNPSVVNILVQGPNGGGQGSGFVYDTLGHIVTNNHVVAGADQIRVTFADGVEAAAEVVGTDVHADLALIKVDPSLADLRPLTLGDSDSLQVGQTVVAIGNPFGLAGSMTTGIVSGLGRLLPDGGLTPDGSRYSIPDIVQTDAAINPGNSGGPLLDLDGNVIGVNTAIESPVRGSSGVGYAVPVGIISRVVPALIEQGRVEYPYLGISGTTLGGALAQAMNLDPEQRGVLVAEVVEGGPAARAGLRGSNREVNSGGLVLLVGGDVIVGIDGREVTDFNDLLTYIVRHTAVGQTVTITLLRDGQQQTVELTLVARP